MIDIAPRPIAEPDLLQHMKQVQYDQKMGLTSVKFDAAIPAAWWWDWRVNRYRSFVSGQFVPLRTVYDILESNETATLEILEAVSQTFFSEEIDLSTWYLTMRRHLTRMHVQDAALGAGGYDQLTQEDFWRIDKMLKEDAPRLKRFGRQIQEGLQSEAQIRNRVNMYAGNARIQFFRAQKPPATLEDEIAIEKRKLNPADHCSYCVYLEELGWQPYGTLPVPGESDPNWDGDQCLTNCKCDLIRQVVDREDAADLMGKGQKSWVADSFLFIELTKAIFNWTEDLHPRWPEGTPVSPFGGEGGGRFMTKPESEKEAIREAYRRKQQAAGEGGGKRTFNKDYASNYAGNNQAVTSAIASMDNPAKKKQYMRQSALTQAGMIHRVSSEFINFAEGITPGIFDTKPSVGRKKKRKGFGAAAGSTRPKPQRKKKAKAPEKEKKDKPEKKKKEPKNIEKSRFLTVRNGMRFLRNTNMNMAAMVTMFGGLAGVRGMNFQSDIGWLDEQGVDYTGSMEFELESGNGVAINWETADSGGVTVNSINFQDQGDADGIAGAMKEMADKGGAPIQINDDGLADIFRSKGWITDDNLYKPKRIGSGPRKSASQFWVKAAANWQGVLRDERGRWKDTPGRGERSPVIAYTFWGDRPRYETLPWRKGELADLEHFGLTRPDIDKMFAPILKAYDLDAKIAIDLDEHDDLTVDAMVFDGSDNVGAFTFVVREVTEGGDLVCNWDFASIDQGKPEFAGIGTMFTKSLLDVLKRSGYESVRIYADVSIGKYAWAKMGFLYDVATDNQAIHEEAIQTGYANKFKEWATKLGLDQYLDEWPKFDRPQLWAEYDISDAPRITANQINNDDVPESMEMPIGKAFMLDFTGHGPWHGVLSLRGKLPARLTKAANISVWADHTPKALPYTPAVLVAHGEVTGASDAFFWPEFIGDETSSQKAMPKDVSHVWRDSSGRWVDTPGIGDDAPKAPEKPKTKEEADAMWAAYLASEEGDKDQYVPRFNYGDVAEVDPLKILPTDIQNEPEGVSITDFSTYWRNYIDAQKGQGEISMGLHRRRLTDAFFEVLATEAAAGKSYESLLAEIRSSVLPELSDNSLFAKIFPDEFTHVDLLEAMPELGPQSMYKSLNDDAKLISLANLFEQQVPEEHQSLKNWIKWERERYTPDGDPTSMSLKNWYALDGDEGALVLAVDRGYKIDGGVKGAMQHLGHTGQAETRHWNGEFPDNVNDEEYSHDKFEYVLDDIYGARNFNSYTQGLTSKESDFYKPTHVRTALMQMAKDEGLDYEGFSGVLRDVYGPSMTMPHELANAAVEQIGGFEGSHAAEFLLSHSMDMRDTSYHSPIEVHEDILDAMSNKMTFGDLAQADKRSPRMGRVDMMTFPPYMKGALERQEFSGVDQFKGMMTYTTGAGEIIPAGLLRFADPGMISEKFDELPDATFADALLFNQLGHVTQLVAMTNDKKAFVDQITFARLAEGKDWDDLRAGLAENDLELAEQGAFGISNIESRFGLSGMSAYEAYKIAGGDYSTMRHFFPELDRTIRDHADEWHNSGIDAYTGEALILNQGRQGAYNTFFDNELYGQETHNTPDLLEDDGEDKAQKDIITTELNNAIRKSWQQEPGDHSRPGYPEAKEFIHQWAESSNGGDMRSMAIQEEAAAMFDIDLTPWQQEEIERAMGHGRREALFQDEWGEDRARGYIRTALESMKEKTAGWFRDAESEQMRAGARKDDPQGREYIRLYRGFKLDTEVFDNLERDGQNIKYKDNALASWAKDFSDAETFASGYASGQVGVLISALIPIDKVLSNSRTGFGCLNETEFVVIGQNGDSHARIEEVYK